jgi:hypothetical protein
MIQSTFSYYLLDSGMFTGAVRRTSRPMDQIPVPEGQGLRAGEFDHLSQKVDPITDQVVDYQPPAPGADYEWLHNDEHGDRVRRWVLKQGVADSRARKAAAQAALNDIDMRMIRALGEHALKNNAESRRRVQDLEDQKVPLRAVINESEPTR